MSSNNSFIKYTKKELAIAPTENGAIAYSSTLNKCLDAFGSLGSMRNSAPDRIINTFKAAFKENESLALKLLFYVRDIREGQGERSTFRTILSWLALNYPECVLKNLSNIEFYGRFDDYLILLGTPLQTDVCNYLKTKLLQDVEAMSRHQSCSLLAKWLPSENTSSKDTRLNAKIIRENWKFSPAKYRKILSSLRSYIDVTEVKMSAQNWDKISYNSVPGKASLNYANCFYKHDSTRYMDYLLNSDRFNAKALFPYDIVKKVAGLVDSFGFGNPSAVDMAVANRLWECLPNYFEGLDETGIVMADTSGSMSGLPLLVSLSLAIYCADKNDGPFKNNFITFSECPSLVELNGDTLTDKVASIKEINCCNTNIEAAFDLILNTALRYELSDCDLPKKLYIISDMQFDQARGEFWYRHTVPKPFMQTMRSKFESAGYTFPSLVYWNVRASDCGMFHQTFEEEDIAIVSGFSPSIFKAVITGTELVEEMKEDGTIRVREKIDPMQIMLTTLNSERYDRVCC